MAGVHLEAADEGSAYVIARVVWGLLLIWTGAVVLLSWGWGIGFLGAGAILLAAQVVRRRFGLKLETFGLAAGALFLLCGAVTLFRVGVDLFPLVCIVAGVALLLSTWSARTRHESGGPTELHAPSHPRG